MDTTMTSPDAITTTLPAGYRARDFKDSDREPWVDERNAQVHELQRGTADEWREWEKIDPPKNLLRVSVDGSDGTLAAGGELGPGTFPRPDGTLFGGVNVMRAHRRKGLGSALLEVVEAAARTAKAPRILAGTSVAFEGAVEWAQKRGFKEIGRRIESYVDVPSFDGRPLQDVLKRVEASGIRLVPMSELLRGRESAPPVVAAGTCHPRVSTIGALLAGRGERGDLVSVERDDRRVVHHLAAVDGQGLELLKGPVRSG